MSYNNLTEEDCKHLLQLLAAATFKGDALDRVFELKQKLIHLVQEAQNGKPKENQ